MHGFGESRGAGAGGVEPGRGRTWVRRVMAARGSALVGVMAIITAVLLVGLAIFILGHSEGDIVEYEDDDRRGFFIAEGGLERARGYLAALEADSPGTNPIGTTFGGQTLGGGVYDVEVVADANPGHWLDAYEVISTGAKDGALRQVKATIVAETFAMYQWFIGSVGGGYSWFRTGERFEGPVHVNGTLGIDGDPWFGGYVRAGGDITIKMGSNPTFMRGYELHVPQVDLPTKAYVRSTLEVAALEPGGLYRSKLGPNKAYWEVKLGEPTVGQLTTQGFDKDGVELDSLQVVNIAALNGAAWFEDDIRIEGTLDGQLTIGVDGNIEVWNDILYAASTPGSGPDPGCDDMLGMIALGIADGDIIIKYTPENANDCEIHGVMMALSNTIEAEEYQHHPLRGDFIIYGGLMALSAIHLSEYTDGVITSGYLRDYHYDPRVVTLPPPFFPFSGSFKVLSWEEVVPVVTS